MEGRNPALVRLEVKVSARAWLRSPTTPKTKCENFSASSTAVPSGAGHGVSTHCMTGFAGVTSCGKRGGERAVIEGQPEWTRRQSKP